MRANLPRSRAEWFVPHETTITLPDGRELQVEGIPYEGWGTEPGRYGYFLNCVELDCGQFEFSHHITWHVMDAADFHQHPMDGRSSQTGANSGSHQ